MEVAAGLIKLQISHHDTLTDWQQHMNDSVEQVTASLKNEQVMVESWFKIEIESTPYLLWYMRAASLEKAVQAFQASTAEIDIFHMQSIMKMAEGSEQILAQPLLDFSA